MYIHQNFSFEMFHMKLWFCYYLSTDMSSWILNLFLSSPLSPSTLFSYLLYFLLDLPFLSSFSQLLILHHLCHVNSIFPSLFLLCASPVCPLRSLFRDAACSPGGVGCCGEESSSLRSSPALCGQLVIIQPETQTGSAAAPGRTLHRQVRDRCKTTHSHATQSLCLASC